MKTSSKFALAALTVAMAIAGQASAGIIELGDGANAQYDCDIAIGDGASAAGGQGAGTPVAYYCATATGRNASATAANTTAYGQDAQATAPNSSATGAGSRATGFFSTANGTGAQANATSTSAFGSSAIANHYNSVALGADTATTRQSEVAVGYRQIGQLLDGTAQDDAVTLRQLEAAIDEVGGGTESRYFRANGSNDGFDDANAAGLGSTAAGPSANASGQFSTCIGITCTAAGDSSFAGGDSAAALGFRAIALGAVANAGADDTIAVGNTSSASAQEAIAIGRLAVAANTAALAVGAGANASGVFGTAIGPGAQVSGPAAAAFGFAANARHANAVALGANTATTKANEVAVGNRQVSQLANGSAPTDATNVQQVAPIAAALGGGANFNNGVFTPPAYNFISGAVYTNAGDALADLDARVWALEQNPPGNGPQGPSGPAGADGDSAYQVAVTNGFNGTEQEWLESLQGADGEDGVGGGSRVKPGRNIEVSEDADGTQIVELSDNIELSDQGSVKVGATTVDAEGVKIQGGPSMTTNGIDAGSKRVLNVAPGRIERGSMDAVNGGQLWDLENRIDDRWRNLDKRVSGVCAMGAAQAQAIGASAANNARRKVSAGLGYCGGQAAMSANMSWDATTPRGSVASFSIGVSSSGDDTSVGAGVSFGW